MMDERQPIDFELLELLAQESAGDNSSPKKDSHTLDDKEKEDKYRMLLEEARVAWDSFFDFRKRRKRNKDYLRGRQWNELTEDDDGNVISEEMRIKQQGKIPLKNNQIIQMFKGMVGNFRENEVKSIVMPRKKEDAPLGDMMSNALEHVLEINEGKEIDVNQFKEILLSGFAGWKIGYKWWFDRNQHDITIDPVHPYRFFCNADVMDFRLNDVNLLGEILDMTLDEVIETFAENREDVERIKKIYSGDYTGRAAYTTPLGEDRIEMLDFYNTYDQNKCRVIELWYQEGQHVTYIHDRATGEYFETDMDEEDIQVLNEIRMQEAAARGIQLNENQLMEWEEHFERIWKVAYVTPRGKILKEASSPYFHEGHPYTIMLYPLIDGEIWGFIEDIIDQQRYINRLIIQMDWMLGHSAKGLLMVPEDVVPNNMTPQEFADEWTKFNGVIFYKPKPHGGVPQQITSSSIPAGMQELLQIQMRLMQEISGVNNAFQGQKPATGTPASLYAQQVHQGGIMNKDYYEAFFNRRKQRDFKVVQMIQQFYDEPRHLNVSGTATRDAMTFYEPERARLASFDVTIGQATNTPLYRNLVDDYLTRFLDSGYIDFRTFLANTTLPFADALMKDIQSREEEMMAMGADPNAPQDPQAAAMMQQALARNPRGAGQQPTM
jgi:hypothetical protein